MTSPTIQDALPTVFVPGLFCSPRVYAGQLPVLWPLGAVTVADHRRDDSLAAIAQRLLAHAPPQFGLVGISMGGYVAFEVLRQAPERVVRLGLLNTSARPDTPEQSAKRREQIAEAEAGRMAGVVESAFPMLVAPEHREDATLRDVVHEMAVETGPEAFVRQQRAIMARPDSRPGLAAIRCPTLVLTGEQDQLIPPHLSEEMAGTIPGARLVRVAGCGHLSTLERPVEVARALWSVWSP